MVRKSYTYPRDGKERIVGVRVLNGPKSSSEASAVDGYFFPQYPMQGTSFRPADMVLSGVSANELSSGILIGIPSDSKDARSDIVKVNPRFIVCGFKSEEVTVPDDVKKNLDRFYELADKGEDTLKDSEAAEFRQVKTALESYFIDTRRFSIKD